MPFICSGHFYDVNQLITLANNWKNIFSWIRELFQFRLTRKFLVAVTIAILLAEIIILIPSYVNYRQSILDNYVDLSTTVIKYALDNSGSSFTPIQKLVEEDDRFLGISLFNKNRESIFSIGEIADLKPDDWAVAAHSFEPSIESYEIYIPASALSGDIATTGKNQY